MALEYRSGGVYYYRSRREGDRVVREYAGCGRVAELAAELHRLDARRRALARRDEADRLGECRREAGLVRAVLSRADHLVAAVLTAAGWHRHNREWRKRRGATMAADLATVLQTWVPGELIARAAGGLDRPTMEGATKGDASTKAAVEKYLDNPAAVALWGDAGRELLGAWVARLAGRNLIAEEAVFRFASDLRARLVGPNPDVLVRLVAERVVVAWVALGYFERWYALAVAKDLSFKQHRHHQRTVDFAHRQFLAAARALAKVRRSKLPDVLALVNVNPPAAGPEGEPPALPGPG
jgi:hypothetical protein